MFKTIQNTPLPVLLVILSFLCPTELSVYIADLRLPPHRFILILLLPIACVRILLRPDVHVRIFDVLFILFNVWTVVVFTMHTTDSSGLIFGGSLALESLGGYAIARAWIRDTETFLASFHFLVLSIGVAMVIALPEMLLGRHFTHDLLQQLTGVEAPRKIETRLGLTRAYGTFDHPIHLGTFSATLLAMVWFATREPTRRYQRAAIVCVATFTALSSAPILCLFSQIGLIIWDRVTRGLPARITITVTLGIALFLAASLFANRSPIAWIATGMTLDSWTGYYRLLIWEHGLNSVWAHPVTGIGLDDWKRPWWMVSSSVDAFWLVVAMRTGIPAFLLLAAAILTMVWSVHKNTVIQSHPLVGRAAKAWVISLIALSLVACTVHYWNVLYAFFFFFLGMAGWIGDPKSRRAWRRTSTARGRATASVSVRTSSNAPSYLPLVYPHHA